MEDVLRSQAFLLPAIFLSSILLLIALSKAQRKFRRLPPSPPGLPILGHLHLIRPPVHRSLDRLSARYWPLLHLRLGSTNCVLAASPHNARELLKAHDTAISNRPLTVAARVFAYGSAGFAFAPYGPYWRFMKKLCISELLGSRTIDQLRPLRRAELLEFLQNMLAKSRSTETADVSWELIKMANNEITRMAASTTSAREGKEARELVLQVAELVGAFNLEDFLWFFRGWDLQGLRKRIRDVHRRFDTFLEKIIKEKEAKRKQKKEVGEGEDDGAKDLLDILLDIAEDENAEMKLSSENIKGFILDIFTAGSGTSAATVDWALAELINHPAVLQKLRKEIDQVVGKDRIVDETDTPNLPYLQAVVKETLRIHPPAPLVHRESTKDIEIGGYRIPANTTVFINLWSIARDPEHWEDPLEFRPERFITSPNDPDDATIDVRGQHFQFLPFGSGRRGCPGINMGMAVVPVTVAAMVQCFEWKVSGGGESEDRVDMEEGEGLVSARSRPLLLIPAARLDPFPSI